MPVLIEKQGGRDGQMTGRSPFMQSVYLKGEASWIGRIMALEITQARQNSLWSAPADIPAVIPADIPADTTADATTKGAA